MALLACSEAARDTELLVLSDDVAVLRRQNAGPRPDGADSAVIATLGPAVPPLATDGLAGASDAGPRLEPPAVHLS